MFTFIYMIKWINIIKRNIGLFRPDVCHLVMELDPVKLHTTVSA